MARYRRNGTPIGKARVYAIAANKDPIAVYEITGAREWEEVESTFELSKMMGQFGEDSYRDDLVLLMPGSNLARADLRFVSIPGADLRGANLSRSYLYGADLRGADLRGTSLVGSSLGSTKFNGADLSGADLSGANKISAEFRGANLSKSKMVESRIGRNVLEAKVDGADFTGAEWDISDGNPPDGWREYGGRLTRFTKVRPAARRR